MWWRRELANYGKSKSSGSHEFGIAIGERDEKVFINMKNPSVRNDCTRRSRGKRTPRPWVALLRELLNIIGD